MSCNHMFVIHKMFCTTSLLVLWQRQADEVDKASLVRALEKRGITSSMASRRWIHVDLIRHWATTFLPPEARFARQAELTWLREVEEMGGYGASPVRRVSCCR